MLEQLTPVLNKILGWLFTLSSEERKRTRDVSDLTRGLKAEIELIRKDVEKRKRNWHPAKQEYSGNLEFEKDISDELGKYYGAKIVNLDLLNDGDLINKVREFYITFYEYKVIQKESVEYFKEHGFKKVYHPAGIPLDKRDEIEDCLINAAQELESELSDKKMKRGKEVVPIDKDTKLPAKATLAINRKMNFPANISSAGLTNSISVGLDFTTSEGMILQEKIETNYKLGLSDFNFSLRDLGFGIKRTPKKIIVERYKKED